MSLNRIGIALEAVHGVADVVHLELAGINNRMTVGWVGNGADIPSRDLPQQAGTDQQRGSWPRHANAAVA